uniref:Uncharacterized protein n=1 Tax=Amphimedon queenslandica TaxID=400682 RepID=A0A1X7TX37_AMPQE
MAAETPDNIGPHWDAKTPEAREARLAADTARRNAETSKAREARLAARRREATAARNLRLSANRARIQPIRWQETPADRDQRLSANREGSQPRREQETAADRDHRPEAGLSQEETEQERILSLNLLIEVEWRDFMKEFHLSLPLHVKHDLSQAEEILVSALMPVMSNYRLPHGQYSYSGHVINFTQDVK